MTTIHPAFDPVTKTFFLTRPVAEAPTISALLVKLGPGYEVADYYPSGTPREVIPRGIAEATRVTLAPTMRRGGYRKPAGEVLPRPAVPAPPPRRAAPGPRRGRPLWEIEHRALDLWAEGKTGKEIAEILAQKTAWVSSRLLPMARKRGDPRALVRNWRSRGQKRPRPGSVPSVS